MPLNRLEREMIAELRGIIGTKIREKDLLEWRTSELKAQVGERIFYLPVAGVWVAIPDSVKIKKPQ